MGQLSYINWRAGRVFIFAVKPFLLGDFDLAHVSFWVAGEDIFVVVFFANVRWQSFGD